MNILYIAIVSENYLPGVSGKLRSKVTALNAIEGITATLLLIMGKNGESESPEVLCTRYEHSPNPYAFIGNNRRAFKEIEGFLQKNGSRYDAILFRYPLATASLKRFMKQYGDNIYFEHNTKEVEECRLFFESLTLKDVLYAVRRFFFSNILLNSWRFLAEKTYGASCIRNAAGIIGVTDEITEYELNRGGVTNKPALTLANGIIPEVYPLHFPGVSSEQVFGMLLISGHENAWTGAERILHSMRNYSGTRKICLYLVGKFQRTVFELIQQFNLTSSVIHYNFLKGEELTAIAGKCHIGIGPMALYKKRLNQACALKTREYLARGMPVLLAYHEMDVSRNESFREFVFQLENNDTLVDLQEIMNWYDSIEGKSNLSLMISDAASKAFSYEKKAWQLADFLKQHAKGIKKN